jgi:hypothetical protein
LGSDTATSNAPFNLSINPNFLHSRCLGMYT